VPGAFFGDTVAADWYFPTQADGSVDAQGVIWLQHGFGATNTFYSALATDLAQRTNSIVVSPTLSSIPFTLFGGGCLICTNTQQAAATAFLDPDRAALVDSAVAAGYTGDTDELLGAFVLAGHSAGGGFASAVASDYVNRGDATQDADLVGVVMFDGVSNGAFDGSFAEQVAVRRSTRSPRPPRAGTPSARPPTSSRRSAPVSSSGWSWRTARTSTPCSGSTRCSTSCCNW